MPKALILVTDGSEEIEFVTPYDGTSIQSSSRYIPIPHTLSVLTRAGFAVASVGVNLKNAGYA
jgi:protein DJ-1